MIGGIEASLRRIAHYDYWQEKVRRSILLDSRADLLVFGNGERQIVEIAHRLAAGEKPAQIRNVRGTALLGSAAGDDWTEIDSTHLDLAGPHRRAPESVRDGVRDRGRRARSRGERARRERRALRAPRADRRSRAQLHPVAELRAGPGRRRCCTRTRRASCTWSRTPATRARSCSGTAQSDVWLNPPPIPLTMPEMDRIYELPYARVPHPAYADAKIPAYEMIRFSVTIQRGCFGGCTFCSITEHEGRIIQNRSEDSVLREIETHPRLTCPASRA